MGYVKVILHKGYYVLNTESLEIVSENLSDPITAEEKWNEIRKTTTGSDKFVIIWVPKDNMAWGE